MIVLDTSVLIAHLDSTDAHHRTATQLLRACEYESLGVSPITMAEVLVGPARAGRLAAVEAAIDELGVGIVPLVDSSPGRLASLRASTRLTLPDCCVLLAAELAGGSLATFDARLATEAATAGFDVRGV